MTDKYLMRIIKYCIIGNPDELKTKMTRTFAEIKFSPEYSPALGIDITTKQMQIDNTSIRLIIVDLTSEEWFKDNRQSYYQGSSGEYQEQ